MLLLNIDTATDTASVCLSQNGKVLAITTSHQQKNHASFLQPAIKQIVQQCNINLQQIDAIGVTYGPGSYTGLRVGLSSAKGLCYALNKPLIVVNTLEVMTVQIIKSINENYLNNNDNFLICPMIDARRMEVFTALYNTNIQTIVKPSAMIIDEKSFSDFLAIHTIYFSGNGSSKCNAILTHSNAKFIDTYFTAADMISITEKYFLLQQFANIAYVEPLYLKQFYLPFA